MFFKQRFTAIGPISSKKSLYHRSNFLNYDPCIFPIHFRIHCNLSIVKVWHF